MYKFMVGMISTSQFNTSSFILTYIVVKKKFNKLFYFSNLPRQSENDNYDVTGAAERGGLGGEAEEDRRGSAAHGGRISGEKAAAA